MFNMSTYRQDQTLDATPECSECAPIRYPIEVSVDEVYFSFGLGVTFEFESHVQSFKQAIVADLKKRDSLFGSSRFIDL